MRIICPGCQKEYQVDDQRIPAKGLRMRCTACQTTITVPPPGGAAIAAPAGPAAPAAPPGTPPSAPAPKGRAGPGAARTLIGVAPPAFAAPGTPPAAPAPPGGQAADLPAPKRPGADPFADLLAPVGARDPFADLPAPRPGGAGQLIDLPAPKPAGAGQLIDLPIPKAAGTGPLVDLPAPKPATGAVAGRDPFADLFPSAAGAGQPGITDLPARKAVDLMDLPIPKAGVADLPVRKDDPFAGLDLGGPAPAGPASGIRVPPVPVPGDPLEMASVIPSLPAVKPMPPVAVPAPSVRGLAGPPSVVPVPPKLGLPIEAPAPLPAFQPPAPPAAPTFQPPGGPAPEGRGGTAFGELDLGEPTADVGAAPPGDLGGDIQRGLAMDASADLDADLAQARASAPPVRQAAGIRVAPPAAAAAKPAAGSRGLLVGVLLLLLLAGAVVPWALGHGLFATGLLAGQEEGAGPATAPPPGTVPDAAVAAAADAADAAPGAATPWGDLPPVNEKFAAAPKERLPGLTAEDYISSGQALLKLQDPRFLTTERFRRLCTIPAFNNLVPMTPGQVMDHLRQLAKAAFDHASGLRPNDPVVLTGLGRVALVFGHAPDALAAFERAASNDQGNAEHLFDQVEALFALRTSDRLVRVEKILMQLDGIAAQDLRLDMYWGDLDLGFQDYGKAAERYARAVEKVRASRGLSPPCAGDACPAAAPDAAAGGAPAAAPQPVPDALAEQAYERLVEYFVLVAQRLKTGEIPALNPDLPEPPEAYLAKAEEKYREAKALLADCLSLDAAYGVALARYGLGANDPATRAAAKAVLQDVQRGASGLLVSLLDPLFYLGLIYRHDREIDKAREVFNDIYRQDNTYPGVFMMQVQLSFSPQMLREQLPTFRQQLETKPDNEEFLLRVGVAAFYAEQYDLALETFQTILRLNPDSADANHYLGRVYFVRRQYAEAKTYLLKAIEKTVTPVASYYLFLGWLYEVEENYGEAIRNLKTAKSLDDTAWEVYWRLGEIYARLRVADADDSAASLFARAAELNPSSASVQASLGRYFEASSDPVAATHYQKALELQALTPELSPAELGAIHTALGKLWRGDRPADAANEFRQALKLGLRIEDETRVKERRPTLLYTVRWYWEAAYWLAQVLRDQNNLPQAAMYFRWVLPYVAGQPEETTARRALAVIEQVIPPDMIRDPGLLRTLDPLP